MKLVMPGSAGSVGTLLARAWHAPVAIAAPGPLPQRAFMRGLRAAWGMPVGLPATRWMLGIGARLLGTETELILKSRRVVSARLPSAGFKFSMSIGRQRRRSCVRGGSGVSEAS